MKKKLIILILLSISPFLLLAEEKYTIGDNFEDIAFSETGFSYECKITGIYPLNDNLYILELNYRDFTTFKLCLSKDSIAFYESDPIDAQTLNKPSENWSYNFTYYQLFALKVIDIGNNYITLNKEKLNKIQVMKIDKIDYDRTIEIIDISETSN